jgi:hypothetical protein
MTSLIPSAFAAPAIQERCAQSYNPPIIFSGRAAFCSDDPLSSNCDKGLAAKAAVAMPEARAPPVRPLGQGRSPDVTVA